MTTTHPHHPTTYTLPSSPTITTEDRFSLVDIDVDADANAATTPPLPFWTLLKAILEPTTHAPSLPSILDALETIALERRAAAPPDYASLASALRSHETKFLKLWPALVDLALDMPALFPSHTVPVLRTGTSGGGCGGCAEVRWRRRQVACLVAHQFLGTLEGPVWAGETGAGAEAGFHVFELWYKGEQGHPRAVGMYLEALVEYFGKILLLLSGGEDEDEDEREGEGEGEGKGKVKEWEISYRLVSTPRRPASADREARDVDVDVDGNTAIDIFTSKTPLHDLTLVPLTPSTSEPAYLGTAGTAVIISANRHIGFGRSATQEEVFVGTAPEACPAVLVTPPLGASEVLVVRGCEAIVKTAGLGRSIESRGLHVDVHTTTSPSGGTCTDADTWGRRTMLFMDALELDSYNDNDDDGGHCYPDLLHRNLEREMDKALVAFGSGPYPRVYTGLWGCGAFGGDPGVKITILWLAASLRGPQLTVLYEAGREEFAVKMERLVRVSKERGWRVGDVWGRLLEAGGCGLEKGGFLDWVLGSVE